MNNDTATTTNEDEDEVSRALSTHEVGHLVAPPMFTPRRGRPEYRVHTPVRTNSDRAPEAHRADGSPFTKQSRLTRKTSNRTKSKFARAARKGSR